MTERINKYRYELTGFFVLLFFYNRTHLPVMAEFPKLCTIEDYISKVSYISIDAILFVISISAAIYIKENSTKKYYVNCLKMISIPAVLCAGIILIYGMRIDIVWFYLTFLAVIMVFIPATMYVLQNSRHTILISAILIVIDLIVTISCSYFMVSIIIAYFQLFVERLIAVIVGISLCFIEGKKPEYLENNENVSTVVKMAAFIIPLLLFIAGFVLSIKAYNENILLLATRYIQMAVSVCLAISISTFISFLFSLNYKNSSAGKYIYRFFGNAGVYFLACAYMIRIKNPALVHPETPWNNHVKNLLTFGKSLIPTVVIYFTASAVINLILSKDDFFHGIKAKLNDSIIIPAKKLYTGFGGFTQKDVGTAGRKHLNDTHFLIFISVIMSFFMVFAFNYVGKVSTWEVFNPVLENENLLEFTKNSPLIKFLCGMILITDKSTETSFCIFILISIAVYYLLKKVNVIKPSIICVICCILFGINQVFGISMVNNFNCNAVVGNKYQAIISVICMTGFSFVGYLAYLIIRQMILPCIICKDSKSDTQQNGFRFLWEHHTFACAAIIMSIAYIPYIAACFPGTVDWDVVYALDTFFSGNPNMGHPVLTTWFYSYFMRWGKTIGNISASSFVLIIIQALVTIYAFSSVVLYLRKHDCSNAICICVTGFYALNPLFTIYINGLLKDTIFASLFTLFILKMAEVVSCGSVSIRDIIKLLVAALLASLFRYNGYYAIIPALFLLGICFIKKKEGIAIILGTIIVIFIYKGIDSYAVNQLNYEAKNKTDPISILLQATANYVNKYPDEITPEERECISKIVDFEYFQYYLGYISDPVKSGCTSWPSDDAYKAYRKCCLNMFLKHPSAFIEAFYANSCGYYTVHGNDMYILHIAYSTNNMYKGWLDKVMESPIEYDNPVGRWACYYITVLFERMPVIGIVASSGLYTWLLFIMFCIITNYVYTEKRAKGVNNIRLLTIFIPYILLIASCCLSPVNNLMRYYLGIVEAFPVILGIYADTQRGKLDNA